MLRKIRNWFGAQDVNERAAERTQKPALGPPRARIPNERPGQAPRVTTTPPANDDAVEDEQLTLVSELSLVEDADSVGPGKNVLAHRDLYRVETGTFETLSIEGAPSKKDPAEGMDPYNTGNFDRPSGWDKPSRK
jgi:hypothetical protein